MPTFVSHPFSSTAGNVPTTSQMSNGGIAVQWSDGRLFTSNGTVVRDALTNVASTFTVFGTNKILVGNSTVNVSITQSSVTLANSTVNFTINHPTAAEQGGTYYLNANGSWTVPAGGGGGGSPGGTNTQVQYNNSGAFAGSAGFVFDSSSNTLTVANSVVINGTTTINTTSISAGNSTINTTLSQLGVTLVHDPNNDPATPPADNMTIFADSFANNTLLSWKNEWGRIRTVQPALFADDICWMKPRYSGTTMDTRGLTLANTIAITARTPAAGNLFLSALRSGQLTGATAGTSASVRHNALSFWRGNAAGLGGFFSVFRFGVAIPTTNFRAFVGFKNSTTVLTNANPSSQTNIIGFGWDSAQTTLRAISANSTVANTVDLGANFPTNVGNTNWYEAYIFAMPNAGNVYYRVVRLNTGDVVTGQFNSTNLPTGATFLTFQLWHNNGSDAVSGGLDFGGLYVDNLST